MAERRDKMKKGARKLMVLLIMILTFGIITANTAFGAVIIEDVFDFGEEITVPEPIIEPEPVVEPEPEPISEPEPEEPEPEPIIEPEPVAEPEPEPIIEPEPVAEPEPVVEPEKPKHVAYHSSGSSSVSVVIEEEIPLAPLEIEEPIKELPKTADSGSWWTGCYILAYFGIAFAGLLLLSRGYLARNQREIKNAVYSIISETASLDQIEGMMIKKWRLICGLVPPYEHPAA